MSKRNNIIVGRYSDSRMPWQGWIEPEDKSWIFFIQDDGKPVVFLNRDSNGGILINTETPE